MVTTPDHAAQIAESKARQAAGQAPGEDTAAALEVVTDGARGDPGAVQTLPPQTPQAPEQRKLPEPKSRFDTKRDEITARFRTERVAEAEDNQDDVTAFTRSGLPPELAPEPAQEPEPAEPEPAADAAADAAAAEGAEPEPVTAAPQIIKLKVRGKEIEMPLEEVLKQAQIALAADNYLEEAKTRLKSVEDLEREARARAAAPAPRPDQHQTGQNGAQQTEQPDPGAVDPQHPEDTIGRLIETIQFGDPEEAKALLRNTLAEAATKPEAIAQAVQQQLLNERYRDEGARAAKTLKDFMDQHPDLAQDPMANAAIEANVYALQLDDLSALGLDPARIRPDGQPATPADIAAAHKHYRAQGMDLRTPQKMLEEATDKFLDWKGVKKQPAAETTPKVAPRVEVTIDRTARRAAIPQQPSRTAAPRPDPQATAQPRDRSSIVEAEKARRAKLRGQNLGIAS